jgi:hypothetical protein
VAELAPSGTVTLARFGTSVAISGTTAVVGAAAQGGNAGEAYVFTRSTKGSWRRAAVLRASDSVKGEYFGTSVGVSGTSAIVGAPYLDHHAGRAYVFTTTTKGVWKQVAELESTGDSANGLFGRCVALSGTTAIVGAPEQPTNTGRAYLFTRTTKGVWKRAAELKGSDTVADDVFGISVAISGTIAVAGAQGHAANAGRAYVFEG